MSKHFLLRICTWFALKHPDLVPKIDAIFNKIEINMPLKQPEKEFLAYVILCYSMANWPECFSAIAALTYDLSLQEEALRTACNHIHYSEYITTIDHYKKHFGMSHFKVAHLIEEDPQTIASRIETWIVEENPKSITSVSHFVTGDQMPSLSASGGTRIRYLFHFVIIYEAQPKDPNS